MEPKTVLPKNYYDDAYDALMFARTPEVAGKAARELVRAVLGEEALKQPLTESLREVCRKIRPSSDPKEQARYELEFVELAMLAVSGQRIAA